MDYWNRNSLTLSIGCQRVVANPPFPPLSFPSHLLPSPPPLSLNPLLFLPFLFSSSSSPPLPPLLPSSSPLLSLLSPILPSHQLLIGYEHNYLELWDALSWKPLSIFGPMKVTGAYENS